MHAEQIKSLIENNLPNNTNTLADVTGDGSHFNAMVISDSFINQSSLERQRAVYTSLQPHIQNGDIHALTIKAYTHQESTQNG